MLDFVVIGAQRAGTTSLFKYLQGHPEIAMPAGKEAPFFSHDVHFANGWEWYRAEYFAKSLPELKWGTVTPHYMIDGRVPQRLFAMMPSVKLVALLRDPVERAYSHYRLNVWRGLEKRPFDEVIQHLLTPNMLAYARTLPSESRYETDGYVVYGEYGRILQEYNRFFPSAQLLIVPTSQLETAVSQVLAFIGVDPAYIPANLGRYYHTSGTQKQVAGLGKLLQQWPWRPLWQKIPRKHQEYMIYWFRQWNQKPTQKTLTLFPEVREELSRHYQQDSLLLNTLFGFDALW